MLTQTIGTTAALLLFALRVAAIPAGILYDNLADSTQGRRSVYMSGPLYDSFSTGSSALSLTDVQLKLQIFEPVLYRPPAAAPFLLPAGYWRPVAEVHSNSSNSSLHPRIGDGSITIALYADNSTSPSALLTTIGTLAAESLTMTPANYDFPLGSAYALSANRRYWIGISTANEGIAAWAVAQDDTGFDVASEFWYASGMVHPNTDPPFQMLVRGSQNIPAAPAPSPLILALAGLACAGLYLNRHKLGWTR